jgi:hypothetical protein
MRFKNWNKEELLNEIEKISIERTDSQVITKYNGRVIKVANVSKIYEIFDIVQYLKDKIELIEANFQISKYNLIIKGGKQSLELLSDTVQIGNHQFYKSFYIINSTDKSRRLSFNVGLRSKTKNFYTVSATNISLSKKHLRGITKIANDVSDKLDVETFSEQIESISNLVGHKIAFSKIREIILGEGDIPKINHRKFDAFKNSIRWNSELNGISKESRNLLYTHSESLKEVSRELDFYLDAFFVFSVYLGIFGREDSHIVKVETERIMNMTQWAVRNSVLESLGI